DLLVVPCSRSQGKAYSPFSQVADPETSIRLNRLGKTAGEPLFAAAVHPSGDDYLIELKTWFRFFSTFEYQDTCDGSRLPCLDREVSHITIHNFERDIVATDTTVFRNDKQNVFSR